jgi:hypothetical protein
MLPECSGQLVRGRNAEVMRDRASIMMKSPVSDPRLNAAQSEPDSLARALAFGIPHAARPELEHGK